MMLKLMLAAAAALMGQQAMPPTFIYGEQPSDWADTTLITNANGVQVGRDGSIQRFHSLAFNHRTGRVIRVYSAGERPQARVGNAQDAGGRTLLPGLIDAHGHVMGLGLGAMRLDLTGTSSIADLQQRLRAYAAANPNAPWILGRGWNQEHWPQRRMPTAADLDAAVRDRPVWLVRVDGHAAVANSAAMRIAGVTRATPTPAGGKIEKDARGNPTGLFIDAAEDLVASKIPAPTREQREAALARAQELMLASGLTAVADMGTSAEDWAVMADAARLQRLNVRIISYSAGLEPLPQIAPNGPTPWLGSDRLRLVGVKIYGDGALGSRGAWLKQPYADQPDTRGLQFLQDDELMRQLTTAAQAGLQPAVHAIGDAANEQVIRAYEQLGRTYTGDRRWRIEHAQVVDPADIPRLAPAGIIASMQPIHQVSDRTMAEARLGPHRLTGAYAWQSIARSGGRLAFGSDFPVEPTNPFLGLSAAVSRQDPDGVPPGGWLPQERVSFEQALAGFTRDAAYAGFAEDRIGSLEPGKWADFVIVDRDVSRVDAQSLARTRVLETWVAGKKVWERK